MQDYTQKLEHLKWLKSIGVNYFLTSDHDFEANLIQKVGSLEQKPTIHKALATDIYNANPAATKTPAAESNDIKSVSSPEPTNDAIKQARQLAEKATNLDELRQIVENFDGLPLKNFAKNTVFAEGNPSANIVLIGEAPGATEDEMGVPFCGESGKLLDKMLAAIGLSRAENAYITNTVFWRPPANRRPTQDEIDICRPFVEKHIALLAPKLIILVGSTAATSLLGKHDGISKIRQNAYSYSNKYLKSEIDLKAIFHPAYLLRQPNQKKTTWFDFIKIQQFSKEKGIIQ